MSSEEACTKGESRNRGPCKIIAEAVEQAVSDDNMLKVLNLHRYNQSINIVEHPSVLYL